jgi:hypothetical protein
MQRFRASKFQLVELIIPATVTGAMQQTYFQQQPQLQSISGDRQVYVQAIETYTSGQLKGSPLTSGNAVAAPGDIENAVLVLNIAGTLDFNQVPLVDLMRIQNDTGAAFVPFSRMLFELKDIYQVDWTKSYIQTIIAPITTPPFSYILGVYYSYSPL